MIKKINVWGRNFDLDVIFEVYKGEEVFDIQQEALDAFISAADNLLGSCEELKKYCIEKDADLIGDSISNIFKYVIPKSLYIKRNTKKRTVALLCNYRFDEEHGLALIFENEKLTHIGTQDDI